MGGNVNDRTAGTQWLHWSRVSVRCSRILLVTWLMRWHAVCCRWPLAWRAPRLCADNLDIVTAARKQVGVTVVYDGGYRRSPIPAATCLRDAVSAPTSIVRALRGARSLDLQKRVHEDIVAHRRRTIRIRVSWRLAAPRREHRPSARAEPDDLVRARQGMVARRLDRAPPRDYLPGDIVAWDLRSRHPAHRLISDRKAAPARRWSSTTSAPGARRRHPLPLRDHRLTTGRRAP